MIKKYFAGANTSSGFVNLFDNNLVGTQKVYGLLGKSKYAKNTILKNILKKGEEKGHSIECIMNPFDITMIDGVIFRDIKTAVVDAEFLGDDKKYQSVSLHDDTKQYAEKTEELSKKIENAMKGMYNAYFNGKVIHDEWEKIYNSNMNYKMLDSYGKGLINQLIGDRKGNSGTQKYERFFGASTPDGSVNYIDNITDGLSKRYFIKGRPGTGKSTFLKKLAKASIEAGFDTEVYYCSFDKNSLDMVVVPKLSFCVFDSTSPHEMFPQKSSDSVLDFYVESGLSGVDEKYHNELSDVKKRYKFSVSEGMAYLRLAGIYRKEREQILEELTDKDEIIAAEKLLTENIF